MCYNQPGIKRKGDLVLEKFVINGGKKLHGTLQISGAKNAAVAIIPAALLVEGVVTIENVPDVSDVRILIDIISEMGAKITRLGRNSFTIDSTEIKSCEPPYKMVSKLRASYYLLGALLGRFKHAVVALPGGCDFGNRPIDQHEKGFRSLGADVKIKKGAVYVKANEIKGAHIYFDNVSVGSTINIMIAATRAKGTTVIENAAKEPHIVDVANFLNAMGANIKGAGTDVIRIRGVDSLKGGHTYSLIPDQIETGTYMIAAAATGGDVTITGIIPKHMESLTAKLIEMNVGIEEGGDYIRVFGKGKMRGATVKTQPYPGFPTDLQPQIATLLCLADGVSTVYEKVWDTRFQYIVELNRMGAKIKADGNTAIIDGPSTLSGAPVRSNDLRAGAALVIAGLVAEGVTQIYNVRFIDRGYEDIEAKLRDLGADIQRVSYDTEE